MRAEDMDIETRVVYLGRGEPKRGHIISNKLKDGNQVVAVEWDDGSIAKVNVKDLRTESLEEDYQKIAIKINEAVQALKEANQLASEKSLTLVDLYYQDIINLDPLKSQITEIGWSSSSLSC